MAQLQYMFLIAVIFFAPFYQKDLLSAACGLNIAAIDTRRVTMATEDPSSSDQRALSSPSFAVTKALVALLAKSSPSTSKSHGASDNKGVAPTIDISSTYS